jgi:hypothetical protein
MSVEIYQGSISVTDVSSFNNAVNALFSAAGYSVTTDTSAKVITVNNSSAIFGLSKIHMAQSWTTGVGLTGQTWNLIIDKDQQTLILVSSFAVPNYTSNEFQVRMAVVANGTDIYADGSLPQNTPVYALWNVPNIDVSRTSGQPVVLTVAVDMKTKNIDAPIFVAANGIIYPLGTIIQDGSSKFVSDGNGLAIRVKE